MQRRGLHLVGRNTMSDSFRSMLTQMDNLGATDLYLSADQTPVYRINGKLSGLGGNKLNGENLKLLAFGIMNNTQTQQYEQELEVNMSYEVSRIGRFRVSLFSQKQQPALVIRRIPHEIPKPSDLGIPQQVLETIHLRRGLILITGPSGAGKSTSFSSMLQDRSEFESSHIITFEDPIEYVLQHKQSVVNQREIGVDTKSKHQAMENALRQTPDVIGIGEIRSLDSLEQAISFADSGHLCIATIHANNASQTIERILNMFPKEKSEQILLSLSLHLNAIMAQQLVPNKNGQLVAAFEVLLNTPRMSDLIRNGNIQEMTEHVERESNSGMQSMDQSLYELYRNGTISAETALEYANSYRNMRLKMRLSAVDTASAQ